MSRQSANAHWVQRVTTVVEDRFQLQSVIEQKKHIHVLFYEQPLTWKWVVPSTPSDSRRGTRNNLSALRKGLVETWGSERIRIRSLSEFPVEWAAPFAEERLQRQLEKEWDDFFDELSRLEVT
jgi:hypothetical protein